MEPLLSFKMLHKFMNQSSFKCSHWRETLCKGDQVNAMQPVDPKPKKDKEKEEKTGKERCKARGASEVL